MNQPVGHSLGHMPDIRSVSLKALLTLGRRPGPNIVIPRLAAEVTNVRVNPEQLRAYREVCGFKEQSGLPITFPQVMTLALQMHLLTRPGFPLPLLGLVHLRNHIRQQRLLTANETYNVRAGLESDRKTDKGVEFDVRTELTDAKGAAVWQGVMTVLYRQKAETGGGKKTPPQETVAAAEYATFEAPADIGRRYGHVSGDRNPIHLSALSAKLFGFPQAIAHGMWSLARCAALLEGELSAPPRELEAQFKQPLFLPGRVAVKYRQEDAGIEFQLINCAAAKAHLTGMLR